MSRRPKVDINIELSPGIRADLRYLARIYWCDESRLVSSLITFLKRQWLKDMSALEAKRFRDPKA